MPDRLVVTVSSLGTLCPWFVHITLVTSLLSLISSLSLVFCLLSSFPYSVHFPTFFIFALSSLFTSLVFSLAILHTHTYIYIYIYISQTPSELSQKPSLLWCPPHFYGWLTIVFLVQGDVIFEVPRNLCIEVPWLTPWPAEMWSMSHLNGSRCLSRCHGEPWEKTSP